ncbi:ABC transporter substrate-binding protein [Pseudochelatococcus sp. B33]
MSGIRLVKYFSAAAIALSMTAAAQAETARIGIINALTGAYAFGGVPIHNGMRLAIEQAMERGELGDLTLEIVEGDSASEKGQTITLVSRMTQSDNVLMILGPTTSLEATAGAPVANQHGAVLFGIGSSRGILQAGPWSFKVQQVGDDMLSTLSDYTANLLQAKRVALIYDRANDGFVAQKDAFKKGVLEHGIEISSEDGILASDTDFLALATKLASENIDAFFIAAPAEVGGNFVLQARQAGIPMDVKFVGPSTFAAPAFIEVAGGAAEGSIVLADWFAGADNPGNAEFVESYTAKYGTQPDNWAAMGFALADLAVEAIKRAGPNPTREAVRDALTALRDIPTILGDGTWTMDDDDRDPHYGAVVLTIENDKLTLAPRD